MVEGLFVGPIEIKPEFVLNFKKDPDVEPDRGWLRNIVNSIVGNFEHSLITATDQITSNQFEAIMNGDLTVTMTLWDGSENKEIYTIAPENLLIVSPNEDQVSDDKKELLPKGLLTEDSFVTIIFPLKRGLHFQDMTDVFLGRSDLTSDDIKITLTPKEIEVG